MRLHERGIDRPVRIIWSREESIVGHHKRHEAWVTTKWGATKDGKLTAVEAELILDSGAYTYTSPKVLGNANLMVTGPYEIPNAHVDSYAVTTNNVPGGAFRGFGGPQGAFAAECQMNKLAEALGMDPVELRLKNVAARGQPSDDADAHPTRRQHRRGDRGCAQEAGWGTSREPGRPTVDVFAQRSPFQSLPTDPAQSAAGGASPVPLRTSAFPSARRSSARRSSSYTAARRSSASYCATPGPRSARGRTRRSSRWPRRPLACRSNGLNWTCRTRPRSGNSGSVSASRMTFMAGNSIRQAAQEALAKWDRRRPPGHRPRHLSPAADPAL
jgi:hypothetical protein